MKRTFQSGIAWPLYISIFVLLGIVFAIIACQHFLLAVVLLLPVYILISSTLVKTYYQIDNCQLTIVCGFLFRKTIDVTQITRIRKTTSIENAPALDFKNRIEIRYNKYDSVIVSPQQKNEFIQELLHINPSIENKVSI